MEAVVWKAPQTVGDTKAKVINTTTNAFLIDTSESLTDFLRYITTPEITARAMNTIEPIIKALSSDSSSGFDMNFQQIKPACCDVFVWIAVWRDKIRYWVLSSEEVANNEYYSVGQHRGNVGEGQLWLKETNIDKFDKYEVSVRDILTAIVNKANRP